MYLICEFSIQFIDTFFFFSFVCIYYELRIVNGGFIYSKSSEMQRGEFLFIELRA